MICAHNAINVRSRDFDKNIITYNIVSAKTAVTRLGHQEDSEASVQANLKRDMTSSLEYGVVLVKRCTSLP